MKLRNQENDVLSDILEINLKTCLELLYYIVFFNPQRDRSAADGREPTNGSATEGEREILPRSRLQQHAHRPLLLTVQYHY